MTTQPIPDTDDPVALRAAMVEELITDGAIRSPEVEAAMRSLPRERFVPAGFTLKEIYAPFNPVVTKKNALGVHVSSVSSPQVMAWQMEAAALTPGMRVLEIGSGGCNAALLATVVGPQGSVTTLDIDPEITDRARRMLDAAGFEDVTVVTGDGERGLPDAAPFDAIIVTVGMWEVVPAWVEQLGPGGRLVVPLRTWGQHRIYALEAVDGYLVSRDRLMGGFVPAQGGGEHISPLIELRDGEISLTVDENPTFDPEDLRGVFRHPRQEVWSGARIGRQEIVDTVQLWVASQAPGCCGLNVDKDKDTGLIETARNRRFATAFVEGPDLAYLLTRAVEDDETEVEYGVHAYGPGGKELATRIADLLAVWGREQRGGPGPELRIYPAGTPDDRLPEGARVLDKTHSRFTFSWPTTAARGNSQAHQDTTTE